MSVPGLKLPPPFAVGAAETPLIADAKAGRPFRTRISLAHCHQGPGRWCWRKFKILCACSTDSVRTALCDARCAIVGADVAADAARDEAIVEFLR